jgi:hypothetical protein
MREKHLPLYWVLSTFPLELAKDMCEVNGISYIEARRELELYEKRDYDRYMPFGGMVEDDLESGLEE